MADRLDSNVSTIRRHYQRDRSDGYLVMHEVGHRGQGQRTGRNGGHMTVFHYVTPTDPTSCETCLAPAGAEADLTAQNGAHSVATKGAQSDGGKPRSNWPQSADRDARPIEAPETTAPRYSSRAAIVAAITGLGRRPNTADHPDRPPVSSGCQPAFPDPSAAAGSAPDLTPDTGTGPSATTDRARESPDWSAEAAETVARQLDAEQMADAGFWAEDAEEFA